MHLEDSHCALGHAAAGHNNDDRLAFEANYKVDVADDRLGRTH